MLEVVWLAKGVPEKRHPGNDRTVRELAVRQGAQLWLDWSQVGVGSRFVLSFPELPAQWPPA